MKMLLLFWSSRSVLLTVCLLLLGAGTSWGKVVFVNGEAPSGGDGTSWATAHQFLQDVLAATEDGDQVWVAAGTYFPDRGALVALGDRTASFIIKDGVALYGGFTGHESDISERDWSASSTVLSGEISGDKMNWSLHVVTVFGGVTIDGVTITKGNANEEGAAAMGGGGIYATGITDKALNFENCIFSGNSARYGGGAIYSHSMTSSITVTNCTFSDNAAGWGGAIYSHSSTSSLTATNCTFSGNSANTGPGGAIHTGSSLIITDCTFNSNWTNSQGGAIYSASDTSSASIAATNCTFSDNFAVNLGGAIYFSSSRSRSTMTATNCTFSGNSAGDEGGAIYLIFSSVTIANCTFSGNSAGDEGGAIHPSFSSVTIANCTFSENLAGTRGGAINAIRTSITATDCSFNGNSAGSDGGAIYCYYLFLTNCTFSDNSAGRNGGAIFALRSFLVTVTTSTFSDNSANSGGAVYSGPLIATNSVFSGNSANSGGAISSGSLTATNCTFTKNSANFGGAIFSLNTYRASEAILTNCTLADNRATDPAGKGHAINAVGLLQIFNNIIWDTSAEGHLVYLTETASIRNINGSLSPSPDRAKNLIRGGIGAVSVEGGATVDLGDTDVTVLSGDPLFLNAGNLIGPDGQWGTADDGLRLRSGSPVIDQGLAAYLPADEWDLNNNGDTAELLPVDIAGFSRIQGAAVDLGAYEHGVLSYAVWASVHGLGGNDVLPEATPANDGVANLVKYALGIHPHAVAFPTDGESSGLPAMLRSPEEALVFSFVKDTVAEVELGIWSASDLLDWSSVVSGIVETPLGDGRIRIEVAAPIADQMFYRLGVESDR